MRIVLSSSISGSGKSVALSGIEDAGYYSVDNLPPDVLAELARYLAEHGQHRLAVAIDARSSASLDEMPGLIRDLSREHDVRVLFLNASTQALIQRFSETRRRHPLSGSLSHDADVGLLSSLEEAIERERHLVAPLA
ncbi:RNase adaptor protein RapZ, partial [Pseudomonas sp. MWU12-2534b]